MKASVIILNYNFENYISKAIESCLNQNYLDLEIIVYDDGSNDNSVRIIKSYKDDIILLENKSKSKNPFNSINQYNGIKNSLDKASGDIIFLLDGDDYFLKDKVISTIRAYKQNKSILSVQDSMLYEYSKKIVKQRYIFNNPGPGKLKKFIVKHGFYAFIGPQTSALSFRKQYLEELLNNFDPKLNLVWPDVQLGRPPLLDGLGIILKKHQTIRRIHKNGDSQKLKSKEYLINLIRQLDKFYGYPKRNDSLLKRKILFVIYLLIYNPLKILDFSLLNYQNRNALND